MEFCPSTMGTTQLKLEPDSVAGVAWQLTEDTPDRRSVAVPLTVSDGGLAVVPFVGAVIVTTGAFLSILIFVTLAGGLTFPALSVQVPEADSFLPSVLRITGTEHFATP